MQAEYDINKCYKVVYNLMLRQCWAHIQIYLKGAYTFSTQQQSSKFNHQYHIHIAAQETHNLDIFWNMIAATCQMFGTKAGHRWCNFLSCNRGLQERKSHDFPFQHRGILSHWAIVFSRQGLGTGSHPWWENTVIIANGYSRWQQLHVKIRHAGCTQVDR